MNQPQVYMYPPYSEPPSPPHPSGLSQSTIFGCLASCIELALVIYFHTVIYMFQVFPGGSDGKVSA